MRRLAFEVVKYKGILEKTEEDTTCFKEEEDAICFLQKYCGGNGFVRLREVSASTRIYKSLDEYEDENEWARY